MLTVQFVDHSDRLKEVINRKLEAAIGVATEYLTDSYVFALQASVAPPHSEKGEIPHAYGGHVPGGFGPVHGAGQPNNTPLEGFVREQPIRDFLSNYLRGGVTDLFDSIEGYVGFAPSHVGSRNMNYLLQHDRDGRPWVKPVFDRARGDMANEAKRAFEGTK